MRSTTSGHGSCAPLLSVTSRPGGMRYELNRQLRAIMRDIHDRCVEFGAEAGGRVNYSKGANIGGFVKVADAPLAYGAM